MFNKRGILGGSRKYSREFFQTLCNDLTQSGFDDIKILLPHNIVKLENSIITVDELLKRERNYPSLILKAISTSRNETFKILFINKNSNSVFADDTFPNAQSEPPQLYFQSPDPGRAYSVYNFFHDYLTKSSLLPYFVSFLSGILSFLVLIFEIVLFFSTRKGLLIHWGIKTILGDIAIFIIALFLLFQYHASPRGLWIKPKRELRVFYLLNMALHGEYKDNPLISLIFSIVGSILATLLLQWIGVIQ